MADRAIQKRSGTLVSLVAEDVRNAIQGGRYPAGARLPSEARLSEIHGVSRTVVREAIAVLKADGLVESRQGSGMFVLDEKLRRKPAGVDHVLVASAIELLEIRTPVEIEAAGFAALRRSPAQERKLVECHAAIRACMREGRSIREADFELHVAVAEATNNAQFVEFLRHWGVLMIPRSELITGEVVEHGRDYLEQLDREHERIVMAISNRDEAGARDAMRQHLKGSQLRHRELLQLELNGDTLFRS